jgi:hypothetical protein
MKQYFVNLHIGQHNDKIDITVTPAGFYPLLSQMKMPGLRTYQIQRGI